MMVRGLAALATIVLLAAPALAQADTSTLTLTDEAPPGTSAPSTQGCGTVNLHGLAPVEEAANETAKAYATQSSAIVTCRTLFWLPAPDAFEIQAAPSANLAIGCEEPTVMAQGYDNVQVELTREDVAVANGSASVGPTCNPDEPMRTEIELDRPDASGFGANSVLGLNVSLFGSPDTASENLHLLVGGTENASQLTVPGLEQAYDPDEPDSASQPLTGANTSSNTSKPTASTTPNNDDANGTPALGVVATLSTAVGLAADRRR
jgi:hypothetical protein